MKSKNFSGREAEKALRKAKASVITTLVRSTHFRFGKNGLAYPCDATHPQAQRVDNIYDLFCGNRLGELRVGYYHLNQAVQDTPVSISQIRLMKYEQVSKDGHLHETTDSLVAR